MGPKSQIRVCTDDIYLLDEAFSIFLGITTLLRLAV